MSLRSLFNGPAAFGAAMLVAQSAGAQAVSGDQLFRQRCQTCHSIAPGGAAGPIGPNLRGVVGRQAAAPAVGKYSPALKASNVSWTRPNLDRFLTAPTKMVPGTRMVIAISNPQQRAAILDYLTTQR